MKYREFLDWCDARAADGCWSMMVAIFCITIIKDVQSQVFWKREKRWQELEKSMSILEYIVIPINQKIEKIPD